MKWLPRNVFGDSLSWRLTRRKALRALNSLRALPVCPVFENEVKLVRQKIVQVKNLIRNNGSFPFVPPPSTLCAPQLQSTCNYKINHYGKILHVRLGGANIMRPLSWGGGGGGGRARGHKRKISETIKLQKGLQKLV